MNKIEIHIENYDQDLFFSDIDFSCVEEIVDPDSIICCSIVTVRLENPRNSLKIKFAWKENDSGINHDDFLFVPETNTLFFKSTHQWGAIDLTGKLLRRHESASWDPFIEKKGTVVLIVDDLTAESTELNGDKIDSVPIDPPTESIEFDDRIEFNSPVFGKQVLKLRL